MKVNSNWLRRLWKKRRIPLTNREDSEKRPRISSPMQRPAYAPREDEVQDDLEKKNNLGELDGHLPQDMSDVAMSTNQGGSSHACTKQDEASPIPADQAVSSNALPNQDEANPMVANQGGSSNPNQDDAAPIVANQGGSLEFASSSPPAAHQGGSSNVSESTEMPVVSQMAVVASQAPQSPAASVVSMSSAGNHRLRSRATNLIWQSVFCSHCNCEYGQYKYDPSPGARDSPTWDYCVADEEGLDFFVLGSEFWKLNRFLESFILSPGHWPVKGQFRKRTIAQKISEEQVKEWLLANKQKCRCT